MQVLDIQLNTMRTPKLGRHTIFLGEDHAGAIIGSFTSIAKGVYIHGPTNHAIIRDPKLVCSFDFNAEWGTEENGRVWPESGYAKGTVEIGSDVWIGQDAKILNGITIGDGAIIGAHTVVSKHVPPYAVVVGNPGEIKRFRYSQEIIDKLRHIRWFDWDDATIKQRLPDMLDVEAFVEKYA